MGANEVSPQMTVQALMDQEKVNTLITQRNNALDAVVNLHAGLVGVKAEADFWRKRAEALEKALVAKDEPAKVE